MPLHFLLNLLLKYRYDVKLAIFVIQNLIELETKKFKYSKYLMQNHKGE